MASSQSTTVFPDSRIKDLSGQTFGQLHVIAFAGTGLKGTRGAWWRCLCTCGNETVVRGSILKRITSCGCHVMVHGPGAMAHWREYVVFIGMWNRCTNPNTKQWADYGGRGITVCGRWKNFQAFLEDVGPRPSPRHTLDRYPNNNGNYEPGNVRWATRTQQARNSRHVRLLTCHGLTMSIVEWVEYLGISRSTLEKRLASKWPLERALTVQNKKHSIQLSLSLGC